VRLPEVKIIKENDSQSRRWRMRLAWALREAFRLEVASIRIAGRCALLAMTPFRRLERHRVWQLNDVLFGANRLGVYPEVDASALALPSLRVTLAHLTAEGYNVSVHELLVLVILVARTRARCVFEFGTADGRTTLNLALNTAPNATVYTLNLPLEEDPRHKQSVPVGAAFHGTDAAAKVVQLWGNARTFDYTPYAGRCQMVFIDADHSDEGVTADTRAALGLVDRNFGLIAWHDALRYGVQTALPRAAKEIGPVHLISRTNLAVLCFCRGKAVSPSEWIASEDRA
jgi:predicted O-methyltransferase YrrM